MSLFQDWLNQLAPRLQKNQFGDWQSLQHVLQSRFEIWQRANEALLGPFAVVDAADHEVLLKRVQLCNDYLQVFELQMINSGLDAVAISEGRICFTQTMIQALCRDLVFGLSKATRFGGLNSLKHVFFKAPSYAGLLTQPHLLITKEYHDLAIGVQVAASLQVDGAPVSHIEQHTWDIPAIVLDVRDHFDEAAFQAAALASQHLKQINTNALYLVIANSFDVQGKVVRQYAIDAVYILSKTHIPRHALAASVANQTQSYVFADVLVHCFNAVREHLTQDWNHEAQGVARGMIIK